MCALYLLKVNLLAYLGSNKWKYTAITATLNFLSLLKLYLLSCFWNVLLVVGLWLF